MRWPGLWLDRKLSFKVHADEWNSKAKVTTPLPALYRESGFPLIGILIESHRRRFAARLQSLDPGHPLVKYLKPPDRGRATRLQRTAALLPQATRPLRQPRTPRASIRLPDKVTAKQRSAEVYDAEVLGALAGLKRALNITTHRVPIHVCLDNNSVIGGSRGRPGESSQQAFLEFRALAKAHGGVRTRWCPGHMGIDGNEVADASAKKGCSKEPHDLPLTPTFIRRQAKAMTRDEFLNWWTNNMPEAYIPLGLKAELRCPKELTLPRSTLRHLLAARTHHGDFADYHERFNHADSANNCSCGRRKNAYTSSAAAKWRLTNDYGWDRRRCRRSTGQ
ncbi:hypothetical protein FDECE_11098 [Fusarium decemcellulare]|nr:hypothetical protein FDECE_11098 [Fusarium decemcellulare]